ncbi:hypothetical protein GGP58_002941 [Salinibacter ruber]|nr:hypothetical protein [Salinibacter ruber]
MESKLSNLTLTPIFYDLSLDSLTCQVGYNIKCESGVESEKEHRGGEPTERMNEQSLV